jgi:glutaconate CoA-transferase, subunit A
MNFQNQGQGELFTNPDPDKARNHFRTKSRKMVNKVSSLKQAVEAYVHDGEYLCIGGFGTNRVPVAACHEIVRQKKKNMGFAGHTACHDMQILSAGKVYNRVDVAYIVGLEARGLSSCSRKYMESGDVTATEWTNYALALRLKAAAMGVPFLPARNMLGTDTFKYSAAKTMCCPFTENELVLLPALYPDVAFIHVHEADVFGNCRFKGPAVADIELANAAKHLVITTERLIPHETITQNPSRTQIAFHQVDAVCEVPFGAYSGNMPYEYFSDEDHLKEWLNAEKTPETFEVFLAKHIFDCKDHEDYLHQNGGLKKIQELRAKELYL